jgi:hypothetical protein
MPFNRVGGGGFRHVYSRLGTPSRGAFNPRRLSGLVHWLDAQNLGSLFQDSGVSTAVAANNDPVGGWKDLSNSALTVIQATSAKRATYKTGVINTSYPGLLFDNTASQYLAAASAPTQFSSTTGEIWLVSYSSLAAAPNGVAWSISQSNAAASIIEAYTGNAGKAELDVFYPPSAVNRVVGNTALGNSAYLTRYVCDGSQYLSYVNGAAQTLTVTGANNGEWTAAMTGLNNVTIGAVQFSGGVGGFLQKIYMGEVLVFNTVLATDVAARLQNYLHAKWGFTF